MVRPRQQIDEIIGSIPPVASKTITMPNLNFIEKLGTSYVKEVSINIKDSESKMVIQNMPQLQYEVIKKMSPRLDITIIDESVTVNNGLVNGALQLNYKND